MIDIIENGVRVPMCTVVATMVDLLHPSGWFYPNTAPKDTTCICGIAAEALNNGSTAWKLHLLSCLHENATNFTQEPSSKLHFCFSCAEHHSASWKSHCETHLASLDLFCGQVSRRGIILRAALCPFCLGDIKLDPSARFHQFTAPARYLSHIEHHLRRVDFTQALPPTCPHPLCEVTSSTPGDFWNHLSQHHGVWPARAYQGAKIGDVAASGQNDLQEFCLQDWLCDADGASFMDDLTSGPVFEQDMDMDVLGWPASHQNEYILAAGDHSELGTLLCQTCHLPFGDVQSYLDHCKSHELKLCPQINCEYSTRLQTAFRQHLLGHGIGTFVCSLQSTADPAILCRKAFATQVHLERHEKCLTQSAELTCATCGRQFRSDETLSRHVLVSHIGERPYPCAVLACSKTFATPWAASRHTREVHGNCVDGEADAEVGLAESDKSCGLNDWLAQLGTVTNEALVWTDINDPTSSFHEFASNANPPQAASGNQPVGDGQKLRWDCPEGCSVSFHAWGRLRQHLVSVHGKSQFICNEPMTRNGEMKLCGQACRDQWSLDRHIAGHRTAVDKQLINGEKRRKRRTRNQCEQCAKQFDYPSQLKKHCRAVHGH